MQDNSAQVESVENEFAVPKLERHPVPVTVLPLCANPARESLPRFEGSRRDRGNPYTFVFDKQGGYSAYSLVG